ncbi:MAG: OadG family protein [Bacteroidales bacterium]|nr:OadG family protein [Bacteroidales bacterium]
MSISSLLIWLPCSAAKVMENDPHGWFLSIVSVAVVFTALLILFLIYNLSGNIFTGKFKIKSRKSGSAPDEATAAAIALALDRYSSEEDATPAVIAMALHLYLSESIHDVEPGIITIRPNPSSEWANKSLTFRKKTH